MCLTLMRNTEVPRIPKPNWTCSKDTSWRLLKFPHLPGTVIVVNAENKNEDHGQIFDRTFHLKTIFNNLKVRLT